MSDKFFDYNSTSYNEFLDDFRKNPSKKRIIILAGNFKENRTFALSQFEMEALGNIKEIYLSDYITEFENETYQKLNGLFEKLKTLNSLIVFKKAEQLCGVYVGHTYSVVKYATPQEKYFIKKLNELAPPVILEFENEYNLDKAIERIADVIIRFPVPSSSIEKIFFAISQFRVNGSNLPCKRPV